MKRILPVVVPNNLPEDEAANYPTYEELYVYSKAEQIFQSLLGSRQSDYLTSN